MDRNMNERIISWRNNPLNTSTTQLKNKFLRFKLQVHVHVDKIIYSYEIVNLMLIS